MPGSYGGGAGLVKGPFAGDPKPGYGKTYFSNQTQPMSGVTGSRKKKRAKRKSKSRY